MQADKRLTPEVRDFLRHARVESKRIGDRRHDIIHGLLHLANGRTLTWCTQRVLYDGPFAKLQQSTYSNDDLKALAVDIATFARHLSPRVWVIIGGKPNSFAVSDLQQVRRELGMTHLTVRIPTA